MHAIGLISTFIQNAYLYAISVADNLGGGLFEDQPEMTLPPAVQDNFHSQPPVLDREGALVTDCSFTSTVNRCQCMNIICS